MKASELKERMVVITDGDIYIAWLTNLPAVIVSGKSVDDCESKAKKAAIDYLNLMHKIIDNGFEVSEYEFNNPNGYLPPTV